MKILKSTRIVILTKERAYKIPIDYRGWLQGRNEKRVWKNHKESNLLAPLLWEFFGIVCQIRVKSVFNFDEDLVKKAKFCIPQFRFDNCDLYNRDNWGFYYGNQVLIDYGVDEKISKMY